MFYVLDGSGFLFRAYYSLPSIVDKNGKNSAAVFGFFRMLLKLLQEKPEYFTIAFDPGRRTIRSESFKEYKANRPEIEDVFKKQIPIIIDICRQTGFDVQVIENYEADDVIASLIKNYKDDSVVVSSDKDLKQLIDDKVKFLEPKTMEYTDKKKFTEDYGFSPSGMVLYLALLGDASDNISGVNGVGKKTASNIVSKHDNIIDLFENLDDFPTKLANKLKENKELIEQNIKLVNLYEPGTFTHENIIKTSNINKIDFEKLKDILVGDFGFNSFGKLIEKAKNELKKPTQTSLF